MKIQFYLLQYDVHLRIFHPCRVFEYGIQVLQMIDDGTLRIQQLLLARAKAIHIHQFPVLCLKQQMSVVDWWWQRF